MTTHDKWLKSLKKDKFLIADFYLYLNDLRAMNQKYLITANTIEDVKRLQGSIMTLDNILNFITQEDEETRLQNEYSGGLENESV